MTPQPADFPYLMQRIAERFAFTTADYPALSALTAQNKQAFLTNHSLQHMCKTIGVIAGQCEGFDHGGTVNEELLKESAVKMVINAMKFAGDLGMTANELVDALINRTK